jgi:hypothetical protein
LSRPGQNFEARFKFLFFLWRRQSVFVRNSRGYTWYD